MLKKKIYIYVLLNWKKESIQELETCRGFKFISHLVFYMKSQSGLLNVKDKIDSIVKLNHNLKLSNYFRIILGLQFYLNFKLPKQYRIHSLYKTRQPWPAVLFFLQKCYKIQI